MENASKALLMAGGMLLAILILTLLIYAWSLFSKYQSSGEELANIENVSKFNQQFTNYDRNDVEGYEILSLVNQIVDYNQRKSNTGKNDENYNPISIKINLVSPEYTKKFTQNEDSSKLFINNPPIYTQSDTQNAFKVILDIIKPIEDDLGGGEYASKIAKNYDSIFLSEEQIVHEIEYKHLNRDEVLSNALEKYNSLTIKKETDVNILKPTSKRSQNVLLYYEYMQFKRGVFKCISDRLTYDPDTGRVNNIEFEFTGKIH